MTYREIKKDSQQAGLTFKIAVFISYVAALMFASSFAIADDLDPHYKFSDI